MLCFRQHCATHRASICVTTGGTGSFARIASSWRVNALEVLFCPAHAVEVAILLRDRATLIAFSATDPFIIEFAVCSPMGMADDCRGRTRGWR